jgi:hypothetical protein
MVPAWLYIATLVIFVIILGLNAWSDHKQQKEYLQALEAEGERADANSDANNRVARASIKLLDLTMIEHDSECPHNQNEKCECGTSAFNNKLFQVYDLLHPQRIKKEKTNVPHAH